MSEKWYSRRNCGQGGEAPQIDMHLSDRDPDALEEELADIWDAMDDKNFDPRLIDAYLAALDKKEPQASDFSASDSLKAFREKHALLFEQMEPASKSSNTALGKHRRFKPSNVIVIVIVATLLCMAAIQALGCDVIGIIAHWTEDTFQFTSIRQTETGQENTSSGKEYVSLEEALLAYGITVSAAPSWYPPGFEMNTITVTPASDEIKFRASYQNGEKFIAVTIWQYASAEDADISSFEKDDSPVISYERGGITHYLMSNEGQMRGAWTNQNMVCSISGDLSEDELKQMINSIYER